MNSGLKLEKQQDDIPRDWERVAIDEVCTIGGGKTPSKSNEAYWDGSIPWVSPKDFDGVALDETEDNLTQQGVTEPSINLYEAGNIALVVRSGVLRHSLPVAQLKSEMAVNQDIKVLQPDTTKITSDYLLNILLYEADRIRASCVKTGTTVESVETAFLKAYKLPLPPLPEQRRIADILSTVDEQIQQTDHLITEFRDLRRGLRQDMYQAGLANSSLADHPTIGEYPENWSVAELSAVAEVTMGSSPKSKYYNEEGDGLPFFQGSADFGERTPTVTTWCSKPNKTASQGDILMSVRAPVGDLNIAVEECCIGRGLASISPTDIDPSYLYEMLVVRKEYLASIASGSTFESINSSELRTLDILVPKTEEQEIIGDVLGSVTKRYEKEQEHKQKLEELKRGLMQDLLTGNVRVDPEQSN